jgi:hypothetical protein
VHEWRAVAGWFGKVMKHSEVTVRKRARAVIEPANDIEGAAVIQVLADS